LVKKTQYNIKKTNSWLINHPRLNPLNFSVSGTFRTLTNPWRILPNYILVGFPKCGSASLSSYTYQHPNIGNPSHRGKYFFDTAYWRGTGWYRAHFPSSIYKNYFEKKHNQPYCTGEYSSRYIIYYPAAERIKKLIPNVKLLVILRNPVKRAYSSYHHVKRQGFEKMSFEEAIKDDHKRFENWKNMVRKNEVTRENIAKIPTPHISIGMYAIHLKKWFEVFPREQFLILQTEDMQNDPQRITDQVFNFLRLPGYKIKEFSKKKVASYEKMKPETNEFLKKLYKPYNEELEKLLHMKFNWDE